MKLTTMKVLDAGLTKYMDCYELQKSVHAGVKSKRLDEHLIVTEHEPVMTIGRIGSRNNLRVSEEFLRTKCIDVIDVDRGGDITYHGPGQIVIYPIIGLKNYGKDLHKYLRSLEEIIIATLKECGVKGFGVTGKTGVWTDWGKIASIGIGVSGWITYHGLAVNIDCDLTSFRWINPCGFKDINVTSVKEIVGEDVNKNSIKKLLIELFCEKYEYAAAMA